VRCCCLVAGFAQYHARALPLPNARARVFEWGAVGVGLTCCFEFACMVVFDFDITKKQNKKGYKIGYVAN
jgi:hypothetical protein